jgi:A nuclease of the HNH/ENDO VII superfamily with conserved WHH
MAGCTSTNSCDTKAAGALGGVNGAGQSEAPASKSEIAERLGIDETTLDSRYPDLKPGDRIVMPEASRLLPESPAEVGKRYGINEETMRQHNPHYQMGDPVAVPQQNDTMCRVAPPPEPMITKPAGVCDAPLKAAQAEWDSRSWVMRTLLTKSDPVGVSPRPIADAERFQSACEALPDSMRKVDFDRSRHTLAEYDAGRLALSPYEGRALRQEAGLLNDVYFPADGPVVKAAPQPAEVELTLQENLRFSNNIAMALTFPFSAPCGIARNMGADEGKVEACLNQALAFMDVAEVMPSMRGSMRGSSAPLTPGSSMTLEPPSMGIRPVSSQAQAYAELVQSNQRWSWAESFPGGADLTGAQRSAIRKEAIDAGLIPPVSYKPGTKFPDFEAAGLVSRVEQLPRELWLSSDKVQFAWLNSRLPGGQKPEGFTWHHSDEPGRMELVPFGVHNILDHEGGRASGMWADAPR